MAVTPAAKAFKLLLPTAPQLQQHATTHKPEKHCISEVDKASTWSESSRTSACIGPAAPCATCCFRSRPPGTSPVPKASMRCQLGRGVRLRASSACWADSRAACCCRSSRSCTQDQRENCKADACHCSVRTAKQEVHTSWCRSYGPLCCRHSSS